MKRLLYLKSWQLYLLIFIPIGIGDIFFSFLGLVGWIIYLFWVYAIGTIMHSLIQKNSKPKIIYFKISCLIVFLIVLIFYESYFLKIVDDDFFLNYFSLGFAFVSVIMVIQIYTFLFAASMLESSIQGKIVNRSDSLKVAFFIWFFPIGIWYIQPLIKKVLAEHEPNV